MRIRERRTALGLTQQQFGDLIGVTYQQIHKYEHGKNGLSAGQLYELARGSGAPVEYFFEGLEANERQLLPRQRRLLDVIRSLGEIQNEGQKAAIGYLVRSLVG
jgi:transcriptional regulator with XRE-family HTH domain